MNSQNLGFKSAAPAASTAKECGKITIQVSSACPMVWEGWLWSHIIVLSIGFDQIFSD
jgi:hypothetical protein